MEFLSPHYREYVEDFRRIAEAFSLDPDHLAIEFYAPRTQAIVIEEVENEKFKLHINLEENRIISCQRISRNGNGNGHADRLRSKYRRYMK